MTTQSVFHVSLGKSLNLTLGFSVTSGQGGGEFGSSGLSFFVREIKKFEWFKGGRGVFGP